MSGLIRVQFLKAMAPYFAGDFAGFSLAEVERMEHLKAVVRVEAGQEDSGTAIITSAVPLTKAPAAPVPTKTTTTP